MNTTYSDKNFIKSLGIDHLKCDLISFLVINENLNTFQETEHFYYWFHKDERVLKDNFGFLNFTKDKSVNITIEGKDYDLNSFEGIASLVVNVKKLDEISKILNNFNLGKTEYFLRYSKKYNKLEYFCNVSSLNVIRKKNICLVKHQKYKLFYVNEKNYVLFYLNNRTPRYISNKNAAFLKPSFVNYNYFNNKSIGSFQDYEDYLFNLNRILLSIHQKSRVFNEYNFLKSVTDLKYIPNKLMLNINSFDELLNKITKNKPVPKILLDKFNKCQLIYLFDIIEFDEVDKIIKFIYETIDIYEEIDRQKRIQKSLHKNINTDVFNNRIHDIIFDYLSVKFGFIVPDKNQKQFKIITRQDNHILHDYIRMCEMLRKKINLKIKSFKRLVQEHDDLSLKISINQIPEIKPNKNYPKIDSVINFEIEKIIDKKRLVLESKVQKHCVKTYHENINRGLCCIYSFLDKRDHQRYTLEIQRKYTSSNDLVFILNQIRGKFNKLPSPEILSEINIILKKYNILPDTNEARNKFGKLYNSKNKTNEHHEILPF